MISQPGALSRLLRGCGLDDKLPPIETPKRVDVMPDMVGVPISASTPHARVCPTCHIFEKEAHTSMCPKCTLKAANRQARSDTLQRHYASVDREITERDGMLKRAEDQVRVDARMIQKYSDRQSLIAQLDEWDVDWRLHYGTIEQAEANYLRERQP